MLAMMLCRELVCRKTRATGKFGTYVKRENCSTLSDGIAGADRIRALLVDRGFLGGFGEDGEIGIILMAVSRDKRRSLLIAAGP